MHTIYLKPGPAPLLRLGTRGLLGRRWLEVPSSAVTSIATREQAAAQRTLMPLQVRGHRVSFIAYPGGEFPNPALFDRTIAHVPRPKA